MFFRIPPRYSAACEVPKMETLDPQQIVWAPHPVEGYQLCRIVDLSTNTLTLDPIETSGKVCISLVCHTSDVFFIFFTSTSSQFSARFNFPRVGGTVFELVTPGLIVPTQYITDSPPPITPMRILLLSS